jgi:DNA (cytosine-5)-methyltransferase 1
VTFGSLFAGIGGMDLGLERAGMRCAWQVEIDDYARRVLEKHWPDVRRWDDVRTFPPNVADTERLSSELRRDARDMGCEARTGQEDGTQRQRDGKSTDDRGSTWHVDLIAGGFPCQDISYAGKGAGLAGERSGLWYEFARIVRIIRPRYVLVENVSALLTRGLDAVLGTLASLGYDAEWHCIPAASVGAPHIRDRVFVVAYRQGDGRQQGRAEPAGEQGRIDASECRGEVSRERYRAHRGKDQWGADPADDPQSGVGRVAHGVPNRVDRLRGIGNAVVPQVAEWIGRRIMEHEIARGITREGGQR